MDWIYDRKIAPGEDEYPIRHEQVQKRVDECVQVLELMERLNQGVQEEYVHFVPSQDFLDSFKFKLYTEKAVIAGHSFGGATTVRALFTGAGTPTSKFKVGVGMDTWMFPLKHDADEIMEKFRGEQQNDEVDESPEPPPKMLFVNCQRFQGPNNLQTMSKFQSPIE